MAKVSPARSRIVFRAIRSAILKGEDVDYWALRMYEQQDAGVLTDAQVAELEALIEEYYERHEGPEADEAEQELETEEE